MLEIFEFRVPESHAARYLPESVGVRTRLGIARKIEAQRGEELFLAIRQIDRDLRAVGSTFFTSWSIHHRVIGRGTRRGRLV